MSRILLIDDDGFVIEYSGSFIDERLKILSLAEEFVHAYASEFNKNNFDMCESSSRFLAVCMARFFGYEYINDKYVKKDED